MQHCSIIAIIISELYDDSPTSSFAQSKTGLEILLGIWPEIVHNDQCILAQIWSNKIKAHVFSVISKSLNFSERRDILPFLGTVNFLIDTQLLKLLPRMKAVHWLIWNFQGQNIMYFSLFSLQTYYRIFMIFLVHGTP